MIKTKGMCLGAGCLLVLSACSTTANTVPKADAGPSAFDGVSYDVKTKVLKDDVPDSEAYRLYLEEDTSYGSVYSVRKTALKQAASYCAQTSQYVSLLRESSALGLLSEGNYPRVELVFACVDEQPEPLQQ
ncbi:hypothetical protein DBZ36_05265 [Alginatibacterium sediminis]|uniref:Lipoprotein n=1 Tax=Alginatibacterium sediminis TaxID=2164068 RepID=A0A420EGQ1_9ALTE|nr:hypothetical protein [Alginatibacterium sediminis]RKF19869.1 hypothetical protein DBZ36_05265 [Alginatibacterium sediminis]